MRLYLAGPDVFLPGAVEIGARKREVCAKHGIEGLYPLDTELPEGAGAAEIFHGNRRLMEIADAGVFNLTPFRGPSADVGTAFELGFMHALGKPVFGYTSAPAPYLERVRALAGSLETREGRWWDAEEFSVEDFGLSENLMLAVCIAEASGGIRAVAEEGRDALAALRAFEACMEEIASRPGNRAQGPGR